MLNIIGTFSVPIEKFAESPLQVIILLLITLNTYKTNVNHKNKGGNPYKYLRWPYPQQGTITRKSGNYLCGNHRIFEMKYVLILRDSLHQWHWFIIKVKPLWRETGLDNCGHFYEDRDIVLVHELFE